MGSGASGIYPTTWGSAQAMALRAAARKAASGAASNVALDVVQAALSGEELDPAQVAADAASGALSPFAPGAKATRALRLAEGQPGVGPARFPEGVAQIRHIFKASHNFSDTAENREKAIALASKKESCRGTDANGNTWYCEVWEDGSQFWVEVRGSVIQGVGVNKPPKPWDSVTGLKKNPKEDGSWRGKKA